ncbi:MAG: hypothetical protein ACRC6T_17390 [Sarcina sp.]
MDKPTNDINLKRVFTLAFSSLIIFIIGIVIIHSVMSLTNIVIQYVAVLIALICVVTIVIFVFTFIIGLITLFDKKTLN